MPESWFDKLLCNKQPVMLFKQSYNVTGTLLSSTIQGASSVLQRVVGCVGHGYRRQAKTIQTTDLTPNRRISPMLEQKPHALSGANTRGNNQRCVSALVQNIAVDIMLQEELQDSGVPVASGAVQCSGPTTMLPFGDDSLAPVADDPLAGLQVVINDSNTEIGHLVCTRHQAGKTQAKIHQHTHTSVTSRSTQLTTQAELS
eukprot:m.315328 g.315328  ORF g.315328 m.315328 type:complete len:201 (-) comp55433_c0_seq19:197-799(-)